MRVTRHTGIIQEVNSFTYHGSLVNTTGGTEEDIQAWIGKARTAFKMLNKVWSSIEMKAYTKIKLNSNGKSVFLYGSET